MAAVHILRNAKDKAGAWENPVTALNFAYTALMGFMALMVGSFSFVFDGGLFPLFLLSRDNPVTALNFAHRHCPHAVHCTDR